MKHVQLFESFGNPVSYLIYTDDTDTWKKGIFTLSGNTEKEALDSLIKALDGNPMDPSYFQDKHGQPGKINSVSDLINDLNGTNGTWILYNCQIPDVPLGFNELMK